MKKKMWLIKVRKKLKHLKLVVEGWEFKVIIYLFRSKKELFSFRLWKCKCGAPMWNARKRQNTHTYHCLAVMVELRRKLVVFSRKKKKKWETEIILVTMEINSKQVTSIRKNHCSREWGWGTVESQPQSSKWQLLLLKRTWHFQQCLGFLGREG